MNGKKTKFERVIKCSETITEELEEISPRIYTVQTGTIPAMGAVVSKLKEAIQTLEKRIDELDTNIKLTDQNLGNIDSELNEIANINLEAHEEEAKSELLSDTVLNRSDYDFIEALIGKERDRTAKFRRKLEFAKENNMDTKQFEEEIAKECSFNRLIRIIHEELKNRGVK